LFCHYEHACYRQGAQCVARRGNLLLIFNNSRDYFFAFSTSQ